VDTTRSSRNVRVVPDLDDELLLALGRLEALLLSLAARTSEDDVELPPPFVDRRALTALQVVADVVRPAHPEPVSGRLPRQLPVAHGQRDHDAVGRRRSHSWEAATAYPDKCDAELSRSEQQAYDRVVSRIDRLWSYRQASSSGGPDLTGA
jgi:hypothetical protein